MMKSTLTAHSSASIALLALLTTIAQANTNRYSEISQLDLDIGHAAIVASEAIAGRAIEAELEMDDAKAIWEVDILNESNQVVTVEIDGQTGEVISTSTDDNDEVPALSAVSLSQAIEIVKAVEQGTIVEAELENDDGALIWEVESLNAENQETKFRVHAETGEILL